MTGGRRLALAIWAAGFTFGPVPLLAQSTDPSTNTAPPADTVGPRDLQNFSLSGTVTKQADQPTVRPPVRRDATSPAGSAPPAPETARRDTNATPSRLKDNATIAPPKRPSVASLPAVIPATAAPVASPLVRPTVSTPPQSIAAASPLPPSTPVPLADDHRLLLWPWLLAAGVFVAGMMLLLWRNRQRHALAGPPDYDLFAAPDPELTPARLPRPPEVVQPKSAPPAPAGGLPGPGAAGGMIASRLRPWIELGFQPLRCIVEDHQVTVDFELELFNSGNAPARGVLAEASIFNAGPAQDEEIDAFIAKPVGAGERLDSLAPLQRMNLRTQVVAPRTSVQIFEIGGRQVFVPLIAFNALYRWSGGDGQTSASYLLGRDTKGDKLAPFRVDLGPRVFRGLGARPLPLGARL